MTILKTGTIKYAGQLLQAAELELGFGQGQAELVNEPMQGLPGGEGATRLEVHAIPWPELVALGAPQCERLAWGDGPWQSEADALWYSEGGALAAVLRHPEHGNLCGYVGVPPGHHAHGVGEPDKLPEAHGGVSYTGEMPLLNTALSKKGWWWIGFDCGHAGDLIPKIHVGALAQVGMAISNKGNTYRDLRYVLQQVELLRRRLCIPAPILTDENAAAAFSYLGEVNNMPRVRQPQVGDLDTTPPAMLNVLVDRSDVREVIAWHVATAAPGVKVGKRADCAGVFRMHSGQLMVLHAHTRSGWNPVTTQPSKGGAWLTRDGGTLERFMKQTIRNNPREDWMGPLSPLEEALADFEVWHVPPPPPTAQELDELGRALDEAENAFDLDA